MIAAALYLAPAPLGPDDDPLRVLPPATVAQLARIDYVIAENARSARSVLGRIPLARALQAIEIRELNTRTPPDSLPGLLAPIVGGRDGALLSEAGCPAVADPGAALVALAHARGVRVVPLIGPSAILLALMACGMNGQRFAFAGYVPVHEAERAQRLRALELRSAKGDETQLLIETPYRNQALFDAMLHVLAPATMVAVASDLSLPGEQVRSRSVAAWRDERARMPRTPTVFALHAAGGATTAPRRQRRRP